MGCGLERGSGSLAFPLAQGSSLALPQSPAMICCPPRSNAMRPTNPNLGSPELSPFSIEVGCSSFGYSRGKLRHTLK